MASSIQDTPGFERYAKLLIEASEANIARIESQIRDLECLRARERGIIARLRIAISPVHKLPAELLVEVFRYTCSDYTYNNTQTIKRVQALSHVCAHWRQVAIATPRLWTDGLRISLDETPTDAYLAGLKEWLNRSAPLPISVHVQCKNKAVDLAAVMGTLIATAHRWSDAHFDLASFSTLSYIPSNALKQLRTLTLYSEDTSFAAVATFLLAPNLIDIDLDIRDIVRFKMPWSQIAHLTVNVAHFPQKCLDGLLQCQNLVTANLTVPAWPDHPDVSRLKPITLGKLENLEVNTASEEGSFAPFFASLALPALMHLTISLNFDIDWVAPEFTHFHLRSPNIETLSIGYSHLDSADLMAILRHTPSLSALDLTSCRYSFDETIVTVLSSSHQNLTQLVPRFHSLTVSEGCYDFGEDILKTLIAARWWTDAQLASFPSPPHVLRWSDIFINRDNSRNVVSPQFTAELEGYRRQGLHLEIL
ncbi:hypothetical protein C8R46DRAFT_1199911 [Mycena filopes]|nr:hypothetical protein C8R46DRAFT_1199911 [Mycena filopes]